MSFTVYPAIDLRNGQVVRLAQGNPAQQTVYGDDPTATARRWQAEGAEWAHVVNLDGAFGEAAQANWRALERIAGTGICVQFGGGLRDLDCIRRAFRSGAARIVIGTAAAENPALVDEALAEFGAGRVAVGIDARDGRVRVRGWAEESAVTALDLATRARAQGVTQIVFTDVARDGTGAGVNLAATLELARETGLQVIASGGVASLDDVRRVRVSGLAGVIVGRALYEGAFALREALADIGNW
ncbi:MAG: 1-(5-phosphoribosyl)-5-[(5-phosphoribosylamino)methylideneamino]imidazole-4-carboxamide isomerase [Chloroflexi bacterium]|nr:1-(5-phosphoribosyl)-5-[(5-phosphoribosylamino)methylideneamino]imidazole-4-carboxamide isomerase [Chloroflexota bacterium]